MPQRVVRTAAVACVHALSGLAAGALAGAGLGYVGEHLSVTGHTRGVGLALTLVGLAALMFGHNVLPERNRETSQAALEFLHPLLWAVYNGAALGLGFTTRIRFAVWIAVPLMSLGLGLRWGWVIYGSYGIVRTALPEVVRRYAERRGFREVSAWLYAASGRMLVVSSVALIAGGIAVAVGT